MIGVGKSRGGTAAMLVAASLLVTGCSLTGETIEQPSAVELAAMDSVVKDLQWQGLGFSPNSPRPTVEFEAYVDPDDTDRVYTDCMVEAGYVDWDQQSYGSFGEPPVAERLDLYTCLSRFPLHPSMYGLYSPGQLEAMYDYYQDTHGAMHRSRWDLGEGSADTRGVRCKTAGPRRHVEPLRLRLCAER